VLRSFGDLELLIFGVSLILVLLFFPRGMGGALDLLCAKIAGLRSRGPGAKPPSADARGAGADS